MALEPAGVDLQAKGFKEYIKRLDAIEKKNREVFDQDFKGTEKSFAQVTAAAKKYEKELNDVNKAQSKTQASQKKTATSFTALAAGAIALATSQVARFTIESAKLAGQFQSQQTGLNNLAASFGQSGSEIQASIQSASKGTISGLQAINSANQALLLGVAKTPEEFDNLTRTALTLGRTMGLTATRSIENFTTALGRRSLLILDNFGISAKAVNAEVEKLAQVQFGKANSQLNEAQKNAVFMEAALKIAGEAAAAIGEEAGEAAASFERFAATSENLQITFGEAVRPAVSGIVDLLNKAGQTAQQVLAFISAGAAGIGSIISQSFDQLVKDSQRLGNNLQAVFSNVGAVLQGELPIGDIFSEGIEQASESAKSFNDILDEASRVATERFKEVASTIEGVSFPGDEIKKELEEVDEAVKDNIEEIKALGNALKQAENLALSFARAQEDAARKATREVIKLEEKQAKDRDKLLKKQAKELDTFEKNRLKEIASTEKDIAKERQAANRERVNEQRKLQQQLRQEQERFNLSQLQSERRFQLQETRLRAEGDILALQQLREDRALGQLEEQENFDLSQRQTKEDGKEQQRIQAENLDERLRELKTDLEDQRAELLTGFDNQLAELQLSQQEQRAELERNLAEQEADRRLSQQRQLEDLGRSFANQEAITQEGATAVANELEGIFGIDGTASTIISGFTAQTESEFTSLFERLEEIVGQADLALPEEIIPALGSEQRRGRGSRGRGRFAGSFQDGGVVPGPVGQPQLAVVHSGETVIPAQQTIAAPVIPSQNLNVEMSGGFNITGAEGAGQATVEASIDEMTNVMEIAIRRLVRRGGANG